ncbi:hypothetical protein ACGFW5_02865 [Streptomyces sp. NPDC048416]|uniref:hypothetical protein n=1 Tax=Streptomyces sp. NPDC048416 TaxID=3365546 RepID=UPI00371C597B
MAENPDGQGSGYSAECVRGDCKWRHDLSAGPFAVHRALEDHALETDHVFFPTVGTSINVVGVPGVREHRTKRDLPAGQDPT